MFATALTSHFRSPAILSVHVRRSVPRVAMVITSSPALARAVGDYLRETEGDVSVIWLTSVDSARRRLEANHADRIVVDAALPEADAAFDILHTADPSAHMQMFADRV